MSDADIRQKINQLFTRVAGSGDRDSFEQVLETMRVSLRKEVDRAHAYDEIIGAHLQIRQARRQGDVGAVLRGLKDEVALITRPQELYKPAPSLKSATAKGNAP